MGIQGLYSWIMKKYGSVSKVVQSCSFKKDINNLFIDLNSLIYHSFSSFSEKDTLSYEDLIKIVLLHFDSLVKLISPIELLFISIDGSSPFAKIIEQRHRRFQGNVNASAPKELKFCRSHITVGTYFMELLHQEIIRYINEKKTEFRAKKIVYSSYHTPGEGEYKMFDYIRERRKEKDWKESKSLFFSPDSDLILLTLINHVKDSLLMKFCPNKTDGSEDSFLLICIDSLKQQILNDLCQSTALSSENQIIEDFCSISLLLGNDFIPKFPDFSLSSGHFDIALDVYKKLFVQQGKSLFDDFTQFLTLVSVNCWKKSNSSLTQEMCEKYALMNFYKKKDPNLNNEEKEKLLSDACYSVLDSFYWTLSYFSKSCPSWEWFYPFDYSPSLILVAKYSSKYMPRFHFETIPSPFESLISMIHFNHRNLLPFSLQKLCETNEIIKEMMTGNARTIKLRHIREMRNAIKSISKEFTEEENNRNLIQPNFTYFNNLNHFI